MPATTNSTPAKSRRRMGLRIAAAGILAAVPLALITLPATASAATPDNTIAVAQQVDQPGWDGQDRDHHDGDHRGDRGDHDRDRNNQQQPVWTPPSTGSFG
ncbi:hypothetical protein OHB26_11125 [Nocardia sp. NBC_01503]|uniref:hypothetical protein n=1 Tax=Nocardia sp. NBC_01503 TaxID=2975997 RepID=UPI002E7BC175|nr:hypothetical protein [Nocardia sp. NBC_01503]WTL34694.1 hypothetical protein OHB26_11125 [Nocardia sp. NBC_01503]